MAYHTTTTTTIISTRQNTICHQCPISFKTTMNGLETRLRYIFLKKIFFTFTKCLKAILNLWNGNDNDEDWTPNNTEKVIWALDGTTQGQSPPPL